MVASVVSEPVVDLFEKVQIDQGNGKMVAGTLVTGKLHVEAVLHFTAIGQPGELIGAGGVLVGFGKDQKFVACFQSAGLKPSEMDFLYSEIPLLDLKLY